MVTNTGCFLVGGIPQIPWNKTYESRRVWGNQKPLVGCRSSHFLTGNYMTRRHSRNSRSLLRCMLTSRPSKSDTKTGLSKAFSPRVTITISIRAKGPLVAAQLCQCCHDLTLWNNCFYLEFFFFFFTFSRFPTLFVHLHPCQNILKHIRLCYCEQISNHVKKPTWLQRTTSIYSLLVIHCYVITW